MARRFNGTTDSCTFSPGALAGVHQYGTIALLFKRTATSGASWRCPIYTGSGSVSDWGLACDINTGNVMWFGLGTGESTGSLALNSTSLWYLLIIVKPTGASQTVRFHSRTLNGSTWSGWTHANGSGTVNNATVPTVNQAVMGAFFNSDFFNGDIAAIGIYRNWDPNDATVEGFDWHLHIDEWLDAADLATTGAAVWCPGQGLTSVAIQDLTGGGANETTSNKGTVVADPTGFTVTPTSGDTILVPDPFDVASTFTADLQVAKLLDPDDFEITSNFTADLQVAKLLDPDDITVVTDFTADLLVEVELAPDPMDCGVTFTADLQVKKELSGSFTIETTFDAGLAAPLDLAGEAIEVEATFSAELLVEEVLAGSVSIDTTFTADLMVEKLLEADPIAAICTFNARLDVGFTSPFDPAAQVILWGRNRWFDPQFINT